MSNRPTERNKRTDSAMHKLLGRREETHADNEMIDFAILVKVQLIDRLKPLGPRPPAQTWVAERSRKFIGIDPPVLRRREFRRTRRGNARRRRTIGPLPPGPARCRPGPSG